MEFTNAWFKQNSVAWSDVLADLKGQPIRAIELGVYEGQASCWLAENILTNPKSTLDCVDTWLGSEEHTDVDMRAVEKRFKANISKYPQITPYKMTTVEYLRNAKPADLIYVDASHTSADCLTDGVLSHIILKPNGIIIFDDYLWGGLAHAPSVPRGAIDAFMECYADEYDPLYMGLQVILRRKK